MTAATAFMALFVWANDGHPQPILAFNDSDACWAVVDDNKARGIASECRVAYLISPIGADPAVEQNAD